MQFPSKRTVRWRLHQVNARREAIRNELNVFSSPAQRLNHILSQVRHFSAASDVEEQVSLYLYCMSALVHQMRHGGLKRELDQIIDLALSVLQVSQIHPRRSKLSYLHSDLHLVLSQIYASQGARWLSVWHHSLYLNKPPSHHQTQTFPQLAQGIAAIRLGEAHIAISEFEKAEKGPLTPTQRMRCRLEHIKALRLSGQDSRCLKMAREASLEFEDEEYRCELNWEVLCLRLKTTGDLSPLLSATRKKGKNRQIDYIVELFFLMRSVKTRRWLDRFPTLQSLIHDSQLRPDRKNGFHRCAQMLEGAQDTSVELDMRILRLQSIFPLIDKLLSVDERLLVWASLTRWLVRVHCRDLAQLTLREYQALSSRLSGGKSVDALALLADIPNPELAIVK